MKFVLVLIIIDIVLLIFTIMFNSFVLFTILSRQNVHTQRDTNVTLCTISMVNFLLGFVLLPFSIFLRLTSAAITEAICTSFVLLKYSILHCIILATTFFVVWHLINSSQSLAQFLANRLWKLTTCLIMLAICTLSLLITLMVVYNLRISFQSAVCVIHYTNVHRIIIIINVFLIPWLLQFICSILIYKNRDKQHSVQSYVHHLSTIPDSSKGTLAEDDPLDLNMKQFEFTMFVSRLFLRLSSTSYLKENLNSSPSNHIVNPHIGSSSNNRHTDPKTVFVHINSPFPPSSKFTETSSEQRAQSASHLKLWKKPADTYDEFVELDYVSLILQIFALYSVLWSPRFCSDIIWIIENSTEMSFEIMMTYIGYLNSIIFPIIVTYHITAQIKKK